MLSVMGAKLVSYTSAEEFEKALAARGASRRPPLKL